MTEVEKLFEDWWQRDGKFIDPDTSDVPWFDKRKGLAAQAFDAAIQMSRNYVADDDTAPDQVTFANGRIVTLGDDGALKVNQAPTAPSKI
jgi:hypothetical protein